MALHVLLVEDDELLRGLTARILRSAGHDVHEVRDGPSALLALAAEPRFDVVFSDMKLGGAIDGLALARRALETSPGIGVVLTSGDPSNFRASEGVDDRIVTLAKPYRKEQILTVLETMARRTQPPMT